MKFGIAIITIVVLLLTAPWGLSGRPGAEGFGGMPRWAVDSIVAAFVFAAWTSWALGRFWARFKGDDWDSTGGDDDGR